MVKKQFFQFLLIVTGVLFSNCSSEQSSDKLLIAAAANMQFAVQSLSQSFSRETGIASEVIIGSSGKLCAQIKEGAPFDLFLSANIKYPKNLYENGFSTAKPKIYAYGHLVLWTMNDAPMALSDLVNNDQIKHIALANPKNAPYGKAAIEALQRSGFYEALQDKLVYGESVAQTNQFIISKAAEVGFTAQSVVHSPVVKGKGHWKQISSDYYSPIAQGVVILKRADHSKVGAQKFYHFLFSEKGREILSTFGYTIR